MKILHIVHWPKSGIVNLLYNILAEQRKSDDLESHVIFFKNDSETTKKYSEITKYTGSLPGGVYSIKSIIALLDSIKNISPDIIHVHSFLPHLYAVLLRTKIPLIRTVHSDYPYFHVKKIPGFIKRKIEHYLLKKSSTNISVSKSLTEELLSIFNNVDFETISNGINLREKENTRQSVRQELGIPDNSLVYISVGRLEAQKGFDILIKAFSRALTYSKDIYLLILGEGSQHKVLNDCLINNNIYNQINLLGYQNNPYIYMEASDIYISSARFEGFGLSVAEAQSIGLPVIGFDVTGVRDVVVDGITGVLEPKVDENTLEKLVNYSLANIDKIRIMGCAAEKHIKKNFTINQTAKKYSYLYKKTLNV